MILDIFAQNAPSQEGKAQVELAQLRYRLPRLRGPGHVALQPAGRRHRHPRSRARPSSRSTAAASCAASTSSRPSCEASPAHRDTQRKQRQRSRAQHVAIVGYTNAGKSTLLNRLTDAGVLVEDRLFATLDATTRRLQLPGGEAVLLTDTVGFVRKLPHQLVEAFRSTLEVAADADLLVHVVDGVGGRSRRRRSTPCATCSREIGADDVPELLCFNKADVSPEVKRLVERHPGSVGDLGRAPARGSTSCCAPIGDRLRALTDVVELFVPYDRGDVLAEVHREGEVLSEAAEDTGMRLRARLDDAAQSKLWPSWSPAWPPRRSPDRGLSTVTNPASSGCLSRRTEPGAWVSPPSRWPTDRCSTPGSRTRHWVGRSGGCDACRLGPGQRRVSTASEMPRADLTHLPLGR